MYLCQCGPNDRAKSWDVHSASQHPLSKSQIQMDQVKSHVDVWKVSNPLNTQSMQTNQEETYWESDQMHIITY